MYKTGCDTHFCFDVAAMKVVQAVSTLSMMIAMWSLLVLYKASSTALVDFHVTSKFVAIKLILIVSAIQARFCSQNINLYLFFVFYAAIFNSKFSIIWFDS